MAKRDVVKYYLEQQALYFEMIDNLKDVEEAYKSGRLEEDMFNRMKVEVETIKDNYNRWSFMLFLLNEPNRKEKKAKYLKQNESYYNALKGVSKEALLDESRDALADFKKLVEEMNNDKH